MSNRSLLFAALLSLTLLATASAQPTPALACQRTDCPAGACVHTGARAARRDRQPRRSHPGCQGRRDPAQPRPDGARGGTAVPGQYAGRHLRVDGCRQDVLARLGAGEARRQGCRWLPVHAGRGAGAAPRRRAATLCRQPEGRARTSSWPSSPARDRTTATTNAARRSRSRRAPIRSTSSSRSRTPPASCSRNSRSRSGSDRQAMRAVP